MGAADHVAIMEELATARKRRVRRAASRVPWARADRVPGRSPGTALALLRHGPLFAVEAALPALAAG